MEEGWIKIHRKIRQWQHYTDLPVRAVFVELLFSANVKARTQAEGMKVLRGETMVTIDALAENTGLSRKTVIAALHTLEQTGEITRLRCGRQTKTRVVKFGRYQRDANGERSTPINDANGERSTPIKSTNGEGSTPLHLIYKEEEERKNIINISSSPARAYAREEEAKMAEEFLASTSGKIALRNRGIDAEQARKLIPEILNEWEATGKTHTGRTDLLTHLLATLEKITTKNNSNDNNRNNRRKADDRRPVSIEDNSTNPDDYSHW